MFFTCSLTKFEKTNILTKITKEIKNCVEITLPIYESTTAKICPSSDPVRKHTRLMTLIV